MHKPDPKTNSQAPSARVTTLVLGIAAALILALQCLLGYSPEVLWALGVAAAVMVLWHSAPGRAPRASRRGHPGSPEASDAKPVLKEPTSTQNPWKVLKIDVPPASLFEKRLAELEHVLAMAQRMKDAGAPVPDLAMAILHEEVRYVRVMLSLAREVQGQGRAP